MRNAIDATRIMRAVCLISGCARYVLPFFLATHHVPRHFINHASEHPRLGRPYARGPDHVLFRVWEEIGASGSLSRAICIYRCFLSCARDRKVSSDSCFTSTFLSIEILFYDITRVLKKISFQVAKKLGKSLLFRHFCVILNCRYM